MPFKHKLSRRLAASTTTLLAITLFAAACGDETAVTGPEELVPFDQTIAAALPASATTGVPVRALAKVKVWAQGSRFSSVSGSQSKNSMGTIVEGPTAITSREPYALWRINYSAGVDGWSRGDQLGFVEPVPTTDSTAPVPPPPVVATVSVSPSSVSLATGATSQLAVTLRDAQGNPLTGRAVMWVSLNSAIATVSGAGVVTALAAGSVLVSATSEGVSGTASVTVAAPVVVPPPPPPPPPSPEPTGPSGLFWASDFSTATGSSSAALYDGGRWSLVGGQGLEVVSATNLDFPTANVVRVTAMQATTGYAHLRTEALGALADGQSRFYRVYVRYTFPDNLEDNQTHPIQDGNAGSQINWAWSIRHNNGGPGHYTAALKLHTNNEFDFSEWTPPPLRKGVTYRFEHQIQRVSATQFRLHARIYDVAGTLLYDDDDFRSNYNTASLASNPLFLWNNPANIAGLNGGNNGISGNPTWPFVYAYQGAFAVCATNWCGAYQAGEGR